MKKALLAGILLTAFLGCAEDALIPDVNSSDSTGNVSSDIAEAKPDFTFSEDFTSGLKESTKEVTLSFFDKETKELIFEKRYNVTRGEKIEVYDDRLEPNTFRVEYDEHTDDQISSDAGDPKGDSSDGDTSSPSSEADTSSDDSATGSSPDESSAAGDSSDDNSGTDVYFENHKDAVLYLYPEYADASGTGDCEQDATGCTVSPNQYSLRMKYAGTGSNGWGSASMVVRNDKWEWLEVTESNGTKFADISPTALEFEARIFNDKNGPVTFVGPNGEAITVTSMTEDEKTYTIALRPGSSIDKMIAAFSISINGTDEIDVRVTNVRFSDKSVEYASQVWGDEFDSWDESVWKREEGDDFGTGSWEYNTNSDQNSYVENGKMILKAKPDGPDGYTSARISTQENGSFRGWGPLTKSFKFGKIEASIKMPYIEADPSTMPGGSWPAFWLNGRCEKGEWPNCGEIDIVEIGGANPDVVMGTAINGTVNVGDNKGDTYKHTEGLQLDFHTYGIEWSPNQITFLFDDIPYFTTVLYDELKEFFDHEFYMLFNHSMCNANESNSCKWAQYTEWRGGNVEYPAIMEIDWVRESRLTNETAQDGETPVIE